MYYRKSMLFPSFCGKYENSTSSPLIMVNFLQFYFVSLRKPVGDMRDNPGKEKKKTVNAR